MTASETENNVLRNTHRDSSLRLTSSRPYVARSCPHVIIRVPCMARLTYLRKRQRGIQKSL